jgi:hypothetical protein
MTRSWKFSGPRSARIVRRALAFGAGLALAATVSASAMAIPSAGSASSTAAAAPAASTTQAGFAARPAMFQSGTWYLRNQLSSGSSTSFTFGLPGDIPVMGDWNGDGVKTVGVYRNFSNFGRFYLRNSNSSGASWSFNFGLPGDEPVVGDWNGDGRDEVGLVRARSKFPSQWFERASTSTAPTAYRSFTFGIIGDRPVAGDWNGDGIDTPGLGRDDGTRLRWFLRDANSSGPSRSLLYGVAFDRPVVGDWNGDGRDGLGVVRTDRGISAAKFWYLRNTVTTVSTVTSFRFGAGSQRPAVWTVRL